MHDGHPKYDTLIGYSLEGLLVDVLHEMKSNAPGDGWDYFLKYVTTVGSHFCLLVCSFFALFVNARSFVRSFFRSFVRSFFVRFVV